MGTGTGALYHKAGARPSSAAAEHRLQGQLLPTLLSLPPVTPHEARGTQGHSVTPCSGQACGAQSHARPAPGDDGAAALPLQQVTAPLAHVGAPPGTHSPVIPHTPGMGCEHGSHRGADVGARHKPWGGGEGGGLLLWLDPASAVVLCLTVGAAPRWWGAGGGRGP